MGRQAGGEGQGHGQLLHHGQVLLLQQLKLPLLQLLDLLHLLKLFPLLLLLLLLSLLLLLLSLLEGMDELCIGVKWLENGSNSSEMKNVNSPDHKIKAFSFNQENLPGRCIRARRPVGKDGGGLILYPVLSCWHKLCPEKNGG